MVIKWLLSTCSEGRGGSLGGSSSGSAFHWVISIGWVGSIKDKPHLFNSSAELEVKLTNKIESERDREMMVKLSFTIYLYCLY